MYSQLHDWLPICQEEPQGPTIFTHVILSKLTHLYQAWILEYVRLLFTRIGLELPDFYLLGRANDVIRLPAVGLLTVFLFCCDRKSICNQHHSYFVFAVKIFYCCKQSRFKIVASA